MGIKSYKELLVWQRAMELVVEVYKLTELFPRDEKYGLAIQMQRAAVSIPSNIAEGYRRSHRKEYAQFLSIAFGSAAELETQIEICKRISKLASCDFSRTETLLTEVLRMLNVMLSRLST